MPASKTVGKREFIQHTSKYLKWAEEHNSSIVLTHHDRPDFLLSKIQGNSLKDLQGSVNIKVHGDINESILPGYEEW